MGRSSIRPELYWKNPESTFGKSDPFRSQPRRAELDPSTKQRQGCVLPVSSRKEPTHVVFHKSGPQSADSIGDAVGGGHFPRLCDHRARIGSRHPSLSCRINLGFASPPDIDCLP